MIKFLLSLPLALFVIVEGFVIYKLVDVIFTAANEDAAGLIGDWAFWQIVAAMVAIMVGIVLAIFFYMIVVLKPVFYPPPEDEVKAKRKPKKEPKKRNKKKLIIILIIIGALVIGAGVAGFIFRETVFGVIDSVTSRFFGSDGEDNAGEDNPAEPEDNTQEAEPEPEPEPSAATLTFPDLDYNWILYYPETLPLPVVQPIETPLLRGTPATDPEFFYWSTDNANGYASAADYSAADPSGILAGAIDTKVLNDNVVICRLDSENADGGSVSSVRFWYIDADGIAAADISCETAEMADTWYRDLEAGAIYIEKTPPPEIPDDEELDNTDDLPEEEPEEIIN